MSKPTLSCPLKPRLLSARLLVSTMLPGRGATTRHPVTTTTSTWDHAAVQDSCGGYCNCSWKVLVHSYPKTRSKQALRLIGAFFWDGGSIGIAWNSMSSCVQNVGHLPKAPCRCAVHTCASKRLPYPDFGICVYGWLSKLWYLFGSSG